MKKEYTLDWSKDPVLATQDAPFKVQLDREERVYRTKTKGLAVRLETSPS